MNVKLILLLTLIFLYMHRPLFGSHYAGGEITYEYIGDSTGVAFEYLIELKLYRNTDGISLPTQESIDISSSCFGNQTLTLNLARYWYTYRRKYNLEIPGFTDCADTNNVSPIEYSIYEASVVLPGTCSDFIFSWGFCCRNNNISNLASFPDLYLESFLDNTLGSNSSPKFISEGAMVFCVNQPVQWSQAAFDEDGDSLAYSLAQPLSAANTPIPWASGYSTANPLSSSTGFQLDPGSGLISFSPNQPEVAAFRLLVTQYHRDTLTGVYHPVGQVSRDIQLVISNSCVNAPVPLTISFKSSVIGTNEIPCYDTRMNYKLSRNVDCASIASDGSDFAVYNSLGYLIPVTAAGGYGCQNSLGFTDSIWAEFNTPVYFNDTIFMVVRRGSDQNTLRSICGDQMPENDSIQLTVVNCTTGIGRDEWPSKSLSIYPNPVGRVLNVIRPEGRAAMLVIMNSMGQTVEKRFVNEAELQLPIHNLRSGFYFLRIQNRQSQQSLKFYKE